MRVRVLIPHVLGAGVLAQSGEVIELPEHVARQRLTIGYVEPAPPEAALVALAEPGSGDAGAEPADSGAPAPGEPTAAATVEGEPGESAGVPEPAPEPTTPEPVQEAPAQAEAPSRSRRNR